MRNLLVLALYVLAAIGLGALSYWGAGEVGLPDVPQMVIAGLVFVAVLLFGFQRSGTADL